MSVVSLSSDLSMPKKYTLYGMFGLPYLKQKFSPVLLRFIFRGGSLGSPA